MDAFRKHASKWRDQVAKQQQAVLKQFSSSGYGNSPGSDAVVTDEAELQRHQQLEKLYNSTRAGKHFQRDIVKGVENLIVTGSRQTEVVTKLCDDCAKYASESPGARGVLGRAASHYGTARAQVERERDVLHRVLSNQVAEPLKAMVSGAPLEDARHLAQRYERMRQEAESQMAELERRQFRSKEVGNTAENVVKLKTAELKVQETSSSMALLGKEAAAAMTAVEAQQQRITLQRLIAMVEAERTYHQRAAEILDQILAQMVSERQRSDSAPPIQPKISVIDTIPTTSLHDEVKQIGNQLNLHQAGGIAVADNANKKRSMYLAEVMHSFNAESEGELNLAVGDVVIVRQVSSSGWSEGECKGKAGWFPSAYVEHRHQVPAHKLTEVF